MAERLRTIGSVRTFDIGTGREVVPPGATTSERPGFAMLPCRPGVCQECAVDHPSGDPHNQQSLYYQMRFHGEHGRWPTWTDAMSHCTPEMQAMWREGLIEQHKKHGLPIPADLLNPPVPGR